MLAPAKRAISTKAVNRSQIVRLYSQSVLVVFRDWRVLHGRRIERLQRFARRTRHSRRLKLEEGLVRGNFLGLRRPCFSREPLHPLKALPAELVVIPHRHEGPARPRVLQIRIVKVRFVHGAIIGQRRRDVEVLYFLAICISDDVADAAVVHHLAVFRIPDDLIDEIAKVQHESKPFVLWRALVFIDHSSICILRALIHVLATDEHKPHGA